MNISTFLQSREGDKGRNISTIIINDTPISGYFEYFFVREKTYVKEPERSFNGKIDNLNSYSTFLTPKVKIRFKMMSIETYRKIMEILYSNNEFVVQCYDIVKGEWVTNNMYFYPQDYPQLYQYKLELLGVMDYEIELVGTNTSLDQVSITYHSNPPSGTGSDETFGGANVPKTSETIIRYDLASPSSNYKFKYWNTKADGSGVTYYNNSAVTVFENLVLYAQWESTSQYTLSFDYGKGEQKVVDGQPYTSKTIQVNAAYGVLDTTASKTVTWKETVYSPYYNPQWYRVSEKVSGVSPIKATDLYTVQGNSTIYQLFDTSVYTIYLDLNGGQVGGTLKNIQQEYGSTIYEPYVTKDGKTPKEWVITQVGYTTNQDMTVNGLANKKVIFEWTTMPPTNVHIKAIWE